jgi:hypothetical protein
MLSKILLRSQSLWQLIIAFLGSFLGILILLVALQFYFDLWKTMVVKSEVLNEDYLVIQKHVGDFSTLNLISADFNEQEIEEVKKQKFVDDIGEFKSSLFPAVATLTGAKNLPKMYTDIYFESVPDRFIDVKTEKWKWKPGDTIVPIILPSAYLETYNFAYAPSKNLPPLSEKSFSMLYFHIIIKREEGNVNLRGNVVGFSDRINSILAPDAFVTYANDRFRNKEAGNPTRLILAVDEITNPLLARFMGEKKYDTNQERLKGSRIKSILQVSLTIFLVVGSIIVVLAILGFIQYSQIIISRAVYELRVLLGLGYDYKTLSKGYIAYFSVIFLLVTLCAIGGLWGAKIMLDNYLISKAYEVQPGIHSTVYMVAFVFMICFIFINALSVVFQLRKLARKL